MRVSIPHQVARAQWILKMCDRFHCLPDRLLAQDAELLGLLELEELAGGDGL